jgi:hypothetical protein
MKSKLNALRRRLDALDPPVCANCQPRPPELVEIYEGEPEPPGGPPPCLDPGRCQGDRSCWRVVIHHMGVQRGEYATTGAA